MARRLQAGQEPARHALGGRIGVPGFGIRILQVRELLQEQVVLAVGDLGLADHVIEMVVTLDLSPETFDFLQRGLAHQSVV